MNGRWLWPAASKKEQGSKSGETNLSKPAAAKTNKGRKAGKKSGETDARPDAVATSEAASRVCAGAGAREAERKATARAARAIPRARCKGGGAHPAQPVGDSADLGASRAVDTGAREWWLPRLTPKPPSKRLDGELIPLPHELLTERHAASELS